MHVSEQNRINVVDACLVYLIYFHMQYCKQWRWQDRYWKRGSSSRLYKIRDPICSRPFHFC